MRSEAWLRFEALIITTLLAFSTYPAFSQRTISLSDGKLVDEILITLVVNGRATNSLQLALN